MKSAFRCSAPAVAALAIVIAWSVSPTSAQGFLLALESGSSGGSALTPAPIMPSSSLGSFDIVINPDAGLAANPAALAAFNRAAAQWEAFISDPIVVNLNGGLADLGDPGIIGSTSPVGLQASYDVIRDQMVLDAADEADDGVVVYLPTFAQFSASLSAGDALNGRMTANKANLKALGFDALSMDTIAGTSSDGTITFNSIFAFDYDNSDGVTPGMIDFETVAAHEIGHALGFVSSVDIADQTVNFTDLQPQPLDLFRFAASNNPSTNAEFTSTPRSLTPGESSIFDDLITEFDFSTGRSEGDSRQASHWKDDALTGINIGLLDPTLSTGQVFTVAGTDLRALDVIGYEIISYPDISAIPEPSALSLGVLAGSILIRRRRLS